MVATKIDAQTSTDYTKNLSQALTLLESGQAQLDQAKELLFRLPSQLPVTTTPAQPSQPNQSASESPVPHPTSVDASGLEKFAWGKRFSPEAKKFLLTTAKDFSWHPDWLPSCMAFETAETFSPSIKNPNSSGTGLIQFMEKTCQDLNKRWGGSLTTAKLARMTVEEQLPWVWKYFVMQMEWFGKATSLEDVYMLIYWPSAVGKPLTATLHTKGTSAYKVNSGLDTNKDGIITKSEAGQLVRAKLNKGRQTEYYG